MQLLADRIEAYWTHLHGVGTLENSLWGYDGQGMRVWLDALTIESSRVDALRDTYETVKESVYLRLDFYPLCMCFPFIRRRWGRRRKWGRMKKN